MFLPCECEETYIDNKDQNSLNLLNIQIRNYFFFACVIIYKILYYRELRKTLIPCLIILISINVVAFGLLLINNKVNHDLYR
jgi:predicted RND superfamily exporter protein